VPHTQEIPAPRPKLSPVPVVEGLEVASSDESFSVGVLDGPVHSMYAMANTWTSGKACQASLRQEQNLHSSRARCRGLADQALPGASRGCGGLKGGKD
jgi:hypothetical protein